ncbi:iron ABC transporter permease [Frigoribacterium faeni]|uniref:Iron complex transport system permease protein n=1 Tax=Frigoribacterium faeni TaxID=145483 RepID=A0A7W3JKJ3_9MICO|nr:iron ABC transporter permease [Frigoribacterium faeni]MBA8814535.1 iron complex transport system permease protein [Frigoribacterium faeni]GEK84776.1 iron-hydroxamate transporter permease subunit [Frigoribacterium faeni]
MTATVTPTDPAPPTRQRSPEGAEEARVAAPRRLTLGSVGVTVALVAVVAALALVDVTQGTADVGPRQVWQALTGTASGGDASVVVASRLPRMVAGLLVGLALGVAGSALQQISRNVLASPDTLAVNAGAYAALAVAAVTGFSLPLLASSGVAFVGGLVAAAIVLALSGLGSGTVRLVLAGSALALGLASVTSALLLLFPQQTVGLYQWGQGSISQNGFAGVVQLAPVMLIGLIVLLLGSTRIDALALGDDAARSVGVDVRTTRIVTVLAAVLLSAASVTLAGPIGFVGLCAPALVRLLRRAVPAVRRSLVLMPLAGLAGAGLVLGADVLLRALVGAEASVQVPTGVVTSLLGAVFLVVLAFRARDHGGVTPGDRHPIVSRPRFALTIAVIVVALIAVLIASVLLGDAKLLLGDVANWLSGRSGRIVTYVLDTRVPRVVAAVTAGAALALAGTLVQGVTRNPLAEPGIVGVTGGAGLGAVLLVTTVPSASGWGVAGAAFVGAVVASLLVFGLASRGGFPQNRLVLIGIGVSTATTAAISLLIVLTDPFNGAKALTWLSGSTYGRSLADSAPVALALVVALVVVAGQRRRLDLVGVDDDTPRLLGVSLSRSRLVFLSLAVLLTATAVAAVGVVGFVGLVAPHAARSLVGRRHSRVVPVAVLLGAVLVGLADVLGRTVIAPAQLGAGLLTAVIGTPYFVWLLWRGRR